MPVMTVGRFARLGHFAGEQGVVHHEGHGAAAFEHVEGFAVVFAEITFIFICLSAFIALRMRSEVVPAVVTTFLPARSGKSL